MIDLMMSYTAMVYTVSTNETTVYICLPTAVTIRRRCPAAAVSLDSKINLENPLKYYHGHVGNK